MTEKQFVKLLRDVINYGATIPYQLLTKKDKAAIQLSIDMVWWMTQKLNGDFQMKESDKKLKAEGFDPSEEEILAFFDHFFKTA